MADAGPKLTLAQLREVVKDCVKGSTPVRFLFDGQNLNIESGELMPKGTLVINQIVYWNFPQKLSNKIAEWLNVKAVFDKE